MKRRKFLGISTLIGASAYLSPNILLSNPIKRSKLKLGFIGTGLRGQGMMRLATYRDDVDIPVICDIDDGMIDKAIKVLKKASRPIPKVYNNGDEDFRNMLDNEDLDGVFIATPWEWHHPMSIAAMKAGTIALSDKSFYMKSLKHNTYYLNWFTKEIVKLGLVPIPSVANFILVKFPNKGKYSANKVNNFLLSKGIILRKVDNYGLKNFLRISMGRKNELTKLIKYLRIYFKKKIIIYISSK